MDPNQVLYENIEAWFVEVANLHLGRSGILFHRSEEEEEKKTGSNTRGIERFSARKNFSKILQVSHFRLGYLLGKKKDDIIHFYKVLLGILDPAVENTNETL